MAVAADVKTFWSALLSVLLKCIAAMGLRRTAPAAVAARPQAALTGLIPAAAHTEPSGSGGSRARRSKRATRATRGTRGKAAAPDRTARRAARRTAMASSGTGACRVPAPRGCEPQLGGRDRKRTLPPTMKQRISAEAHGSSPSARSLRVDDLLGEEFAGAVTVPASAGAGAGAGAGAHATAATAGSAPTHPSSPSGTAVPAGAGHDAAHERAALVR